MAELMHGRINLPLAGYGIGEEEFEKFEKALKAVNQANKEEIRAFVSRLLIRYSRLLIRYNKCLEELIELKGKNV